MDTLQTTRTLLITPAADLQRPGPPVPGESMHAACREHRSDTPEMNLPLGRDHAHCKHQKRSQFLPTCAC